MGPQLVDCRAHALGHRGEFVAEAMYLQRTSLCWKVVNDSRNLAECSRHACRDSGAVCDTSSDGTGTTAAVPKSVPQTASPIEGVILFMVVLRRLHRLRFSVAIFATAALSSARSAEVRANCSLR
jgi:hypothetical protein